MCLGSKRDDDVDDDDDNDDVDDVDNSLFVPGQQEHDDDNNVDGDVDDIYIMMKCLCVCHEK